MYLREGYSVIFVYDSSGANAGSSPPARATEPARNSGIPPERHRGSRCRFAPSAVSADDGRIVVVETRSPIKGSATTVRDGSGLTSSKWRGTESSTPEHAFDMV